MTDTDPGYSFEEFRGYWLITHWPRAWRRGQSLFNALHDVWPELACDLTGLPCDPFNDDGNIKAALDWIEEAFEQARLEGFYR